VVVTKAYGNLLLGICNHLTWNSIYTASFHSCSTVWFEWDKMVAATCRENDLWMHCCLDSDTLCIQRRQL